MPTRGAPRDRLTPAAEAGWARFRRHLELSDGFWLAFVFTNSLGSARIFEERTKHVLRTHALRQEVIEPASPEELEPVASRVLALGDLDTLGCVWVTAVHADAPGGTDGRWTEAWRRALLGLNQARQPLRNRLNAGLAIVVPAQLKPSVREAAPDLWSIRALVIDLEGAPAQGSRPIKRTEREADSISSTRTTGSQMRLEPLPADGEHAEIQRQLAERLREAEHLRTSGRTGEALEIGHEAVAEARLLDAPQMLVQALVAVAVTEEASGDRAAVAQHLAELIALVRSVGPETLHVQLLRWAADLAIAEGEIENALGLLEELLALERTLNSFEGETQQALSEIAASLDDFGDMHAANGDTAAARANYQEALDIRRRIIDTYGTTPQALRDLSISLENIGDMHASNGDTAAATANHQEALDIRRRIIDTYGTTPQALRDLSISLDRIGDMHASNGDTAAATANYREALDIDRRIVDTYGTTPQALRDLSISLENIGDMHASNGDTAAATANYQEALDITRRIIDTYGTTPQALRDLSISLDRIGDMHASNGDTAAATANYREALDIDRRIVDTYGTTPQALRDLHMSLDKVADALDVSGEPDVAAELRHEADVARFSLAELADQAADHRQ